MKIPIIEILILTSVAIVIAFSVNFLSPAGIAVIGDWDTTKGVISAKSKKDVIIREIEIDDVLRVKELFDTEKPLFIDARSGDDYNSGHILGALSLPVNEFFEKLDWFLQNYSSTETTIITYCSGRECEDSHKLAVLLQDVGYTDVKVFIDGFPAWEKEGFPVEQ